MLALTTVRLRVRPFRLDEAEAMARNRSNEDVARWVSWSAPFPVEEARTRIETAGARTALGPNLWVLRAVERIEDRSLVGEVGVKGHPDDVEQAIIGYALAREAHGMGFGTEVVRAVVGELFAVHGLHRVTAYVHEKNRASQRVLEKIGFRREALLVEGFKAKGVWVNEFLYAMLAREWAEASRPRAERETA